MRPTSTWREIALHQSHHGKEKHYDTEHDSSYELRCHGRDRGGQIGSESEIRRDSKDQR